MSNYWTHTGLRYSLLLLFYKKILQKANFIQRRLGKSISCGYFCDYFRNTVEKDRLEEQGGQLDYFIKQKIQPL